MKWIDLPPVWLLACLIAVWFSPWEISWLHAPLPGLFLLVVAFLLTVAAFVEFRRAKTTVIPREAPNALITGGIFRWTRNPIYLADVLILLGFTLVWGKLLGVVLLPFFAVMLDRRFIRGEEARLRSVFGEAFEKYAGQTRRWI